MSDVIEVLNQPSAEEIANDYKAAIDSVNLINSEKPENVSNEEWLSIVNQNKKHLQLMLTKDFWTTEDLNPLRSSAV